MPQFVVNRVAVDVGMTMTAAHIFVIANLLALLGWVILVIAIATKRSWLRDTVAGTVWPVLLALLYVVASGLGWGTTGGGFSSLEAVRQHLSGDWPMLAGWVHYLAFDLFIGAWIAAEADRAGLPRLVLVPVLPLTYLFGPVGFLLFLTLRRAPAGGGRKGTEQCRRQVQQSTSRMAP